MGTPDNREYAAAESLEISIVDKRKLLKRPEDEAYIIWSEREVWTKEVEGIYPYSPFPGTAHEEVLQVFSIGRANFTLRKGQNVVKF
ncbi:hypothetical protein G6F46_008099 [Rhizopus delemar]|uniref:Uncharacterized protein n=2 Tax=Rhizopus TaxID=4842 RepID=A0A9P7CLZ2_9FUNG|nr:hypothetical protein G6F55_006886 [Rhizopus delemar]KAG1527833.1 hypothetical protein G6F51_014283 [Rhizopus arrhizus]KAG1488720.1 hypothetical protein G6F52_013850 [Rhizopus delemar]KAG1493479.1 hypothetical protein G6F54_008550 [Rhizopus delemar]KAG1514094.1 hypothetical protein G6F53_003940 [Rhizopus delemar]